MDCRDSTRLRLLSAVLVCVVTKGILFLNEFSSSLILYFEWSGNSPAGKLLWLSILKCSRSSCDVRESECSDNRISERITNRRDMWIHSYSVAMLQWSPVIQNLFPFKAVFSSSCILAFLPDFRKEFGPLTSGKKRQGVLWESHEEN